MKKITLLGTIVVLGTILFLKTESNLRAKPGDEQITAVITQEHQKEVALTVYNQNLGLVKDNREIRLAVGMHEIRFMDVASQINPTTVHLKSLTDPQGLK
ncbi:MAG: hypothetical protein IH857_02705, partial [Deltaproteobacteria bacterium]|nr:hypothetical protein [Deltaproteobacteria bacterium]